MEITINNKKIKINKIRGLISKFRGLKFVLKPINEGYQFQSKYANTYFLCQRIDIVMTDKNNKILYIYQNVRTEKFIFPKFKVYYTYFLPPNVSKTLSVGTTLDIK